MTSTATGSGDDVSDVGGRDDDSEPFSSADVASRAAWRFKSNQIESNQIYFKLAAS